MRRATLNWSSGEYEYFSRQIQTTKRLVLFRHTPKHALSIDSPSANTCPVEIVLVVRDVEGIFTRFGRPLSCEAARILDKRQFTSVVVLMSNAAWRHRLQVK